MTKPVTAPTAQLATEQTSRNLASAPPDPSILATQQVLREISWLRELIETRLNAMDKAITLLQAKGDEIPSETDLAVGRLKDLHEEKFKSIQIQFLERDTRSDQTSRDTKTAVDAALQAAKEAVGEQNKSNALAIAKSEAAFTKQIDQVQSFVSTTTKNVDDKINDLKERLTENAGRASGRGDVWGYIVGGVGVVLGVGGIIALVARLA